MILVCYFKYYFKFEFFYLFFSTSHLTMQIDQRFPGLRNRAHDLVDDFVGAIDKLSNDVTTLQIYKNQNGVVLVEEAAHEISRMIIRQVRGDVHERGCIF